jgi:hypothetical protein
VAVCRTTFILPAVPAPFPIPAAGLRNLIETVIVYETTGKGNCDAIHTAAVIRIIDFIRE